MIIVTHKTYIAPDLSTAFCLRPHEAFAARMKITMFTFRERVCEQSTWFNLHMMMSSLNTFKIEIKTTRTSCPGTILNHAHTRTTTKMGPAKLQMSVSWTESQQKSGFP